jgi:hypothetical protein
MVFSLFFDTRSLVVVKICRDTARLAVNSGLNNCKLGVTQLSFFGLSLTKDGIAVHEDKIKALKEAKMPETAVDLRSFLGLAVYCSPHIPNLAILAAPLWEITREGVKFEWNKEHDEASKR